MRRRASVGVDLQYNIELDTRLALFTVVFLLLENPAAVRRINPIYQVSPLLLVEEILMECIFELIAFIRGIHDFALKEETTAG